MFWIKFWACVVTLILVIVSIAIGLYYYIEDREDKAWVEEIHKRMRRYSFCAREILRMAPEVEIELPQNIVQQLQSESKYFTHEYAFSDVVESTYIILSNYRKLYFGDPEMANNCKFQMELKIQQLVEKFEEELITEKVKKENNKIVLQQELLDNFQEAYDDNFATQ